MYVDGLTQPGGVLDRLEIIFRVRTANPRAMADCSDRKGCMQAPFYSQSGADSLSLAHNQRRAPFGDTQAIEY